MGFLQGIILRVRSDISIYRRQSGRVVRMPDLKSGDPNFKSHSDQQLDLFQVAPASTPPLRLYMQPTGLPPASWVLNLLSLLYFNGLIHWP